jgi:hypothetical protein
VVEVQSATGLGATAKGTSAVKLEADAALHVTVENGAAGPRLVTTLSTVGDEIQGNVNIAGTESIERILHMADNGYSAATTTLGENGTLLLRGAPIEEKGVSAESDLLTGKGSVVVSDPTGLGSAASFGTITDYTGDFRVEGDKASIQVNNGSYSEGSIAVHGQQASVQIGGNVSIAAGESLQLSSTGFVPAQTDEVDMGTLTAENGAQSCAECGSRSRRIILACDDSIFKGNTPSGFPEIALTGSEELVKGILAVDRHQLGAFLIGCRMERDRECQREIFFCEAVDHRNDAAGREGKMPKAHISAFGMGNELQKLNNIVIIIERLSDSHQYDTGNPRIFGRIGIHRIDLTEHFGGSQIADKSERCGCTELTSHLTADLS